MREGKLHAFRRPAHARGVEAPLAPARSFTDADAAQLNATSPAAPRVEKTKAAPARKTAAIRLNAHAVAAALSDRTRFRMMEIFSAGVALSPTHFEYILRGDRRALARHLEILRACGLVIQEKGADARVRLNRIPAEFLKGREDGCYIVDYGSGELRVPEAATTFEKPPTFAQ